MGMQFWWFYDVIAGAVLLICIFLGGKRGAVRSLFTAVSLVIAALVSFGASSAVADMMSKGSLIQSNAKKIDDHIDPNTFTLLFTDYLENMGYSLKVDSAKLGKILDSDEQYDEALVRYVNNINGRKVENNDNILLEKIHKGYAEVIGSIVTESLSKYAGSYAEQMILEDSSGMQELIPLMRDIENVRPAADYIARNYTAQAYKTMFKLVSFVILIAVLGLLTVLGTGSYFKNRETVITSVPSHVFGGIVGIVSAIVIIYGIAVAIRMWAVMGNDEMLFFNNEAAGRSYVFKYFYEFANNL